MAEYGYGVIATVGEDGFNSVDWAAMNKGVTPVFTRIPIHNGQKSADQGRAVYDDVEVVLLHIAGDSYSIHSTLVDDTIKARFSEQYAHWKRTDQGLHITGTPLKMWPLASPAFIAEMQAINIFSVDDLAHIADVNLDKIPDGRVWRDRAAAWLKAASDSASSDKFAAENERLQARIEALEKMVSAPESQSPAARPMRSISTAKSERMRLYWARRKEEKAAQTA